MTNEYGYTNDVKYFNEANEFVRAAVEDGWELKPRYAGESTMRACELNRDGFVIAVITRKNVGKWKYHVSVHAWAPDKLAIKLPVVYNSETFTKAMSTCNICDKEVDKTYRYSFAGRACADCLPQAQKEHEQPGWCD